MPAFKDLKVKLFVDTADLEQVKRYHKEAWVAGYTCNPTLMRKAGVTDYLAFAREYLSIIGTSPVSFEVISDDFDEMERQAHTLAGLGDNVYVKIPITNTVSAPAIGLIRTLSSAGIRVNATAVLMRRQIDDLLEVLTYGTPAIISIFAGRIADTGRSPGQDFMYASGKLRYIQAHRMLVVRSSTQLLWASPRQLLDIYTADQSGADIITVTPELLAKLPLLGKSLEVFSLETVEMFYRDAAAAGYVI